MLWAFGFLVFFNFLASSLQAKKWVWILQLFVACPCEFLNFLVLLSQKAELFPPKRHEWPSLFRFLYADWIVLQLYFRSFEGFFLGCHLLLKTPVCCVSWFVTLSTPWGRHENFATLIRIVYFYLGVGAEHWQLLHILSVLDYCQRYILGLLGRLLSLFSTQALSSFILSHVALTAEEPDSGWKPTKKKYEMMLYNSERILRLYFWDLDNFHVSKTKALPVNHDPLPLCAAFQALSYHQTMSFL